MKIFVWKGKIAYSKWLVGNLKCLGLNLGHLQPFLVHFGPFLGLKRPEKRPFFPFFPILWFKSWTFWDLKGPKHVSDPQRWVDWPSRFIPKQFWTISRHQNVPFCPFFQILWFKIWTILNLKGLQHRSGPSRSIPHHLESISIDGIQILSLFWPF